MKFKITEVDTLKIKVEYGDGSWALIPTLKDADKAEEDDGGGAGSTPGRGLGALLPSACRHAPLLGGPKGHYQSLLEHHSASI